MRMEQSKIWWNIGEEETKQNRWYPDAELTEVFLSIFRLVMQKFFYEVYDEISVSTH